MYPLRSQSEGAVDYMLLRDALVAELVTIREVSEQGSVPDLLVDNRARRPVLIVDGEEFVGAKQDRVANLTLLIAAATTTSVPVSCVEEGRWSRQSDPFVLSERVQHSRGRAARLSSVQESMRFGGTRHSDQSAVWEEIRAKSVAMDAESPTDAMGAFFERHSSTLDELVARFRVAPDVCGGIFAVGGAICGLDAFDKPATFSALLPKLVRSYGIDALEQYQHGATAGSSLPPQNPPSLEPNLEAKTAPSLEQAREFLSTLGEGDIEEHEAVGLGTDIRIAVKDHVAGGLLVDSSLLHVVAFADFPDRQPGFDYGEELAGSQHRRQALIDHGV